MHLIVIMAFWIVIDFNRPAVADYGNLLSSELVGGRIDDAPTGTDSGLGDLELGVQRTSIVDALARVEPAAPLKLRGAKEIRVYAKVSPAVVLVVTERGFGSGSVVSEGGLILTNWHVIEGRSSLGVIFKPAVGDKIDLRALHTATLVKVDPKKDLALLRVDAMPKTTPLVGLADKVDLMVGADVHAIGHPTGNTWTYTKGFVSQLRSDYEWYLVNDQKRKSLHKADVIQTQTPIAPGSSGGPLLDDRGMLIGVNSFKKHGELINFSVTVDEVHAFLRSKINSVSVKTAKTVATEKCKVKVMFDGYDKSFPSYSRIVRYDRNCDGRPDAARMIARDPKAPIYMVFDSNFSGRSDFILLDNDKDGKWDQSLHDTDEDGKYDLIGHHPDGKMRPTRYTQYKQ